MKTVALLMTFCWAFQAAASVQKPLNVKLATGSIRADGASFVWDKPAQYDDIKTYHIFLDNEEIGVTEKCHFSVNGLSASSRYSFYVKAEGHSGGLSDKSNAVRFRTEQQGAVINIKDLGAVGDAKTLNTQVIQRAIDQCPRYGTVLIPAGTFLSGAIFLKSNMTLKIAKNGVLQGSGEVADYLPMINNRFEGWEMKTYASLVNAGVMNHKGGFTVENLSITGEGTIRGAGAPLGAAMRAKSGIRSRGRLILLMNCKNVELQGLHIENSPCWTIHYLYCQGVTLHDLDIKSNAPNGDGIDPDSSIDSYIFNCSFSTGDDCIAIKSGKNPEGYYIGKPAKGVRITECNFIKGHGISIGSEMSGGVSDVLVRDCKAGPLLHGLQIKGTAERGGYVKNVRVIDCDLQQITVFSAVNYNNDGEAAPEMPVYANFLFKNIDLTSAPVKQPVIDIHGFKQQGHELRQVLFENIRLPENARIVVSEAQDVRFQNVTTPKGGLVRYEVTDSKNVIY